MREIKIRIPTVCDLISGEFSRHLIKAHEEFLLALTCIPKAFMEKIEKFEKKMKRE